MRARIYGLIALACIVAGGATCDQRIDYEPRTQLGRDLKAHYETCVASPACRQKARQSGARMVLIARAIACGAGAGVTCGVSAQDVAAAIQRARDLVKAGSDQVSDDERIIVEALDGVGDAEVRDLAELSAKAD